MAETALRRATAIPLAVMSVSWSVFAVRLAVGGGPWGAAWSAFLALASAIVTAGLLRRDAFVWYLVLPLGVLHALWSALWAFAASPLFWSTGAVAVVGTMLAALAVRRLAPQMTGWIRVAAFFGGLGVAIPISSFVAVRSYAVPSGAMAPMIDRGHRILVLNESYALRPVERFDVAVFGHPVTGRTHVSRVVGLPDEDFFLDGGNVYTRSRGDPQNAFRIARKPPQIQRTTWVHDVPTAPLDACWNTPDGAAWVQEGTRLTTTSADTRFTYAQSIGEEIEPVGELCVECTAVLLDASGTFWIEIANAWGRFVLSLIPGQLPMLEARTRDSQRVVSIGRASIAAGRPCRVQLSVYDGIAVAVVDGARSPELEFLDAFRTPGTESREPSVGFGGRGIRFSVADLSIARDLHYVESGLPMNAREPLAIPPNRFLMMGDNARNSYDSRRWTEVTLTLRDGRVIRTEAADMREASESDVLERSERPAPFVRQADFTGRVLGVWWRGPARAP